MLPTAAPARTRRAAAAQALADDARRAMFCHEDLAAWPAWAPSAGGSPHEPERITRTALVAGAWYEAPRLRRCIEAPLLRRLDELLGSTVAQALLAGTDDAATRPAPDTAALPSPGALEDWLVMQGIEVLLAAVESPLVALVLRERHWPRTQPPLPALDRERSRAALRRAELLQ
jgi:hypothetical protein